MPSGRGLPASTAILTAAAGQPGNDTHPSAVSSATPTRDSRWAGALLRDLARSPIRELAVS